ncbi:MAG: flagellar motor switch protein FliG [Thermodesulfobacteriota bacterium]|nr:flagellar motor switch protein FliG [Thermodesulfobacteriota bacterium]
MNPKNLPGPLKAAILIRSLGERESQETLNKLNDEERSLIKSHLSQMSGVSQELMEKVAREFIESARKETTRLKKDSSPRMMQGDGENNDSSDSTANLKAIRSLEPDVLVELIKNEHPQTIAVILVHLDSEAASEVLSKLPDETKTDVSLRIANLDKVLAGMVEEIDKVFEDVLKNKKGSATRKTGGIGFLAEILNQVDGSSGQLIIDEIEEINPELAAEIKQLMFVFDDLALVDDKGLQSVLRNVETKELATALKAASEDVKEKIFANMSERASEMLREDMEAMGAVRMKEVEDAQQKITRIIQDMEAKGEILIAGRRGEKLIT